jgi:hypothetical protein
LHLLLHLHSPFFAFHSEQREEPASSRSCRCFWCYNRPKTLRAALTPRMDNVYTLSMDVLYRYAGLEFVWDVHKAASNITKHASVLNRPAKCFSTHWHAFSTPASTKKRATRSLARWSREPMKVTAQYAEEHFADILHAADNGEAVEITHPDHSTYRLELAKPVPFKMHHPAHPRRGAWRNDCSLVGRMASNGQRTRRCDQQRSHLS